eukprot:3652967-Rhodomonas_salina.1
MSGVDPQADPLVGPDPLGGARQVLLVVAAQLPRGVRCRSRAEHRLHEVLRTASCRGRVGPDQVGPLRVGDLLILEHVLVDAAEEGLREGRLRARRVEVQRQDQRGVARLRVIRVGRDVVRTLEVCRAQTRPR